MLLQLVFGLSHSVLTELREEVADRRDQLNARFHHRHGSRGVLVWCSDGSVILVERQNSHPDYPGDGTP